MTAEGCDKIPGYPKSVTQILVIKKGLNPDAKAQEVEVLSREKPKKVSKKLRPVDREIRSLAYAARTYFDSYDERHMRSAEKKKDGAIKDFRKNSSRARKDAAKVLRKNSKMFKKLRLPKVIRRIGKLSPF